MLACTVFLVALLPALFAQAPAASGNADFSAGLKALERDDYATALNVWRPLAEKGDAAAQYGIGFMYANGKGVPQDDVEAARWFRKAADQGNAVAQLNLGSLYANGQGVPQDRAEAARWYRKAADQGNAVAQLNLGSLYANGQGVPQDRAEAAQIGRASCRERV